MQKRFIFLSLLVCLTLVGISCSKSSTQIFVQPIPPASAKNDVAVWITHADQSLKLIKQTLSSATGSLPNTASVIALDAANTFQEVDGFGFTLTGGSATLIKKLP